MRLGRRIAAVSAASLAGLSVACWFVGISSGVGLWKKEIAGRSQAEDYLDHQIRDVSRRAQGQPLEAGHRPPTEASAASPAVFDTCTSLPAPLATRPETEAAGWVRVPEETRRRFQGDAVLANDRIALVFRRGGPGAEVYGYRGDPLGLQAVLTPLAHKEPVRLQDVELVENSADESAVDVTFGTPDGPKAVIRFEIQAGQAFAKTTVRQGASGLRIEAPCRFAVLPDFFADDIVVDANDLKADKASLPSENFLMHMLGGGESMVLAVWNRRDEDVQVALANRDEGRVVQASEVPYGPGGAIFVALLEGHGIWHHREVTSAEAGRIVRLDWSPPFFAQWRVDWRRQDGLTDSWQMLIEKPDGRFAKLDWFGQSDEDGVPDWLQSGRNRWTALSGSHAYPCWIDKEGRGCFQAFEKERGGIRGPALVYPIHRATATPLAALTVADMMRATLGVGPCEYLLDLEGQQKKMVGAPTCVATQIVADIYAKRQQKTRRAEVQRALGDVLAFVQHIRTRIETYAIFGRRMLAYLQEEEKRRPELAPFLKEMSSLALHIDEAIADKRKSIQSPEEARRLVDQFRATLLDCEDDDALARCERILGSIRMIGGSQDFLVGKCREAVKILRQRATMAATADPRVAPVAREIRNLTHAILRNPTSFEAPRH
jgi:hypothetical protein